MEIKPKSPAADFCIPRLFHFGSDNPPRETKSNCNLSSDGGSKCQYSFAAFLLDYNEYFPSDSFANGVFDCSFKSEPT